MKHLRPLTPEELKARKEMYKRRAEVLKETPKTSEERLEELAVQPIPRYAPGMAQMRENIQKSMIDLEEHNFYGIDPKVLMTKQGKRTATGIFID